MKNLLVIDIYSPNNVPRIYDSAIICVSVSLSRVCFTHTKKIIVWYSDTQCYTNYYSGCAKQIVIMGVRCPLTCSAMRNSTRPWGDLPFLIGWNLYHLRSYYKVLDSLLIEIDSSTRHFFYKILELTDLDDDEDSWSTRICR